MNFTAIYKNVVVDKIVLGEKGFSRTSFIDGDHPNKSFIFAPFSYGSQLLTPSGEICADGLRTVKRISWEFKIEMIDITHSSVPYSIPAVIEIPCFAHLEVEYAETSPEYNEEFHLLLCQDLGVPARTKFDTLIKLLDMDGFRRAICIAAEKYA